DSLAPSPPAPVPGQVGAALDAGAEAGRADRGAVGAREAALGDGVPDRALRVGGEELLELEGVEGAAHPAGGVLGHPVGGGDLVGGRGAGLDLVHELGASLAR